MGLLGRLAGLGRALITRGLGGVGGNAPAVIPIVSVCGDTSVSRDPVGRTMVAALCSGAVTVEPNATGTTRVVPTITGNVSVAEC